MADENEQDDKQLQIHVQGEVSAVYQIMMSHNS